MTSQINTDKNLDVHEAYQAQLKDQLSEDDKRCIIEARLKGWQPIAVTDIANTYYQTVLGAIDKLESSLNTILGRLKNH